MKFDDILEIGIDNQERLYISPLNERFPLIWRSATEVHWDLGKNTLYSPKPREWTYVDWYLHIILVIKKEYACQLLITGNTKWVNISLELKGEIINKHF